VKVFNDIVRHDQIEGLGLPWEWEGKICNAPSVDTEPLSVIHDMLPIVILHMPSVLKVIVRSYLVAQEGENTGGIAPTRANIQYTPTIREVFAECFRDHGIHTVHARATDVTLEGICLANLRDSI
jgi:hypothetical protein